eukprot:TRINITY_DN13536_c0_g1_i2.p1 TRINITY_DN13536_c0_g1~~TRINITY_DN13536_c0_g1_i2.p1  ORF type:complete len:136 (+),score=29.53 TRINITY_DN13536_c0_g1_i2:85-492(+)
MVRDHGERMDVAEFACMIVELGLTPRPMTPWVIKKVFRDANNGNLADDRKLLLNLQEFESSLQLILELLGQEYYDHPAVVLIKSVLPASVQSTEPVPLELHSDPGAPSASDFNVLGTGSSPWKRRGFRRDNTKRG